LPPENLCDERARETVTGEAVEETKERGRGHRRRRGPPLRERDFDGPDCCGCRPMRGRARSGRAASRHRRSQRRGCEGESFS
jgi:hypothetical protein